MTTDHSDRFEILSRPGRKGLMLHFVWDKQKRIYVDSSRVKGEMADLCAMLNERDRKDWDYDNRS